GGVWAGAAEGKGADVDDFGIRLAKVFVGQAQTRHGSRPDIIYKDIGARSQPQKRLPPGRGFEIENQAALVTVGVEEHRAHAALTVGADGADYVPFRRLHLYNFGAETP